MSKSSTTATASKIPPPPLSSKSAWSKGPPPNTAASPRSQSPAPSPSSQPVQFSHSRRPSALGQGIPIKDGVSVPKSNIGVAKQGASVTFGSIDDASATISSSPIATPAIKAEAVKSFGTVPANPPQANGKVNVSAPKPVSGQQTAASSSSATSSSASTPAPPSTPVKLQRMDIAKLFQTAPPAPPSSDSSSSKPPSNTPSQQSGPSSGSQPPQPAPPQPGPASQMAPYPGFPPPNGMRPQPQSGGPGRGGPPGSPVYSRQQIPNGNGVRPPGPPNGPGAPQQMPNGGMPSPRLAPMTPVPPPPQTGHPGHPMMWQPPYYYVDPNFMTYQNGWYGLPQAMPHPQQHAHPPPPHATMPMSPRNPPIPAPGGPGTPTLAHAVPTTHTPHPPPMTHSSSSSVSGMTSTPPTPSTPNNARLNTSAAAFVPGANRNSKIILKTSDGIEVTVNDLKSKGASTPTTTTPVASLASGHTPAPSKRISVRIENPADKAKREAEEKAKVEAEEKTRKAKEEKERKDKEEKERAERDAERKRKEEEEKERKRKEEEEKERQRKIEEDLKEKLRKEEEERKKKEDDERKEKVRIEKEKAEEERKKKEEEAKEQERLKKEKEEQERLRKEEEEKKRKEEDIAKQLAAEQKDLPEEGEIVEDKSGGDATPKEEKSKAKESLKLDITPHEGRKRPGHLDLSAALKPNIPAALPSALATARIIEDINSVSYPEGIRSPKIELNLGARDGKFRYDRDFLMQFMSICKEKPDNLPPLDAIGLEPADQSSFALNRGGSRGHRDRTSSNASQRAASSSSFSGAPFAKGGLQGFPGIGNFVPPASKLSEGAFPGSRDARSVSTSAAAMQYQQRAPMTRTASVGGAGADNKRTRSKRGEKRNDGNRVSNPQHGSSYGQVPLGMEPIVPLQQTANRWDRRALVVADADSPELVDRKVKGLLNKLTMEKFDSISDQIIDWANKSEKEKDGRTLIQVIRLVFEKATDEATWSEMYARLCRKMMETISPGVQDEGIRNAEGKPIAGGQLFRKYLLNRCQEDFERGWVAKEATAAAAASKALEDEAAAAKAGDSEEVALYSSEYYAAQKAKRQGLGLIKFIGELFKLQMLTERIMHECIKKLLGNVDNPEEEEIESLCKLLTTVGSILDTSKARGHLDIYFSRMKELTKSLNVSSRMQFMLQDVLELRERKWAARNQVAAPTTIAQVHQEAAKDRAAQEKESYTRQLTLSMSRGGSKHGKERPESYDGWAVAGGNQPRPPPKAGDLSKFGKISNTGAPVTFGPASVFSAKKEGKKDTSLSRTNSSSNMFSMLSQGESAADKAPEPTPQRKKLALLPRSKPKDSEAPAAAPEAESESSSEAEDEMTDAEAKKKIQEDSKEFFAIRNIEEAEVYFIKLPSVHHPKLVDKLVSLALESKDADAQLVSEFFAAAASKGLCSIESFEESFIQLAEFLDDIAIDAPKAPRLMAVMMKGPSFSDEQRQRIASKSSENGELILDA